jgi:hypothetical protein
VDPVPLTEYASNYQTVISEAQDPDTPQTPENESTEIEDHPPLQPSASSQLFQNFFLPTSRSIISSSSENEKTVYFSSMGPDDLPGLKAWTLVGVRFNDFHAP